MSDLSKIIKNMALGALKGGLITGAVGGGIPAAWHASNQTLGEGLGQVGQFGLISAIPGAFIGALMNLPNSKGKLEDPSVYLGSLNKKNGKLYKDIAEAYNDFSIYDLTNEQFRQLYER